MKPLKDKLTIKLQEEIIPMLKFADIIQLTKKNEFLENINGQLTPSD